MGHQIIKQPDGLYAIYCTGTDTIVGWDATADEVVAYFVEKAAEDARERVVRILGHVDAGNPKAAYYQFAMTWEEAVANDKASTTVGFGDDLDKEWP